MPASRRIQNCFRPLVTLALLVVLGNLAWTVPPTVTKVGLRGAERGKPVEIVFTGTNLSPQTQLLLPFKATVTPIPEAKPNPAQARFQVTVDPSVPLGVYPARLSTEDGLSALFLFCVDNLPGVVEVEDNSSFDKAQKITVPAIVTGECAGGDVDFLRFSAKKGQRLVLETEAVRLGSGIVPQLRLTDDKQRFLAADDSQGQRGDCRIVFTAPADGDYVVEVSDTRYKGAVPPFYRLKIADYDFIEEVFPLGGKRGDNVEFTLRGGSLPGEIKVTRKVEDGPFAGLMALPVDGIGKPGMLPPLVEVGDLPERIHLAKDGKPLEVQPPLTINGRLDAKGQADRFTFPVQPGQRYRIDINAESLGSNLDGVLKIADQAGKQLALVDDVDIPSAVPGQPGTKGHDPSTEFTVPAGVTALSLELTDQRKRGGVNFGYRLTIEPSGNDFELRLPATEVNVPKGGTALVNVNVGRRGYTGPIQLAVADLPAGLTVHGGDIPANGTAGVLTITAPAEAAIPAGALLRIEGKGTVDGKEIKRQALHKLVLSREVNPVSAVLTLPQVAIASGEATPFTVQGPAAVEVVKGFAVDVPVTLLRGPMGDKLAVEVLGNVSAVPAVPGQPPAAGQFVFKAGTAAIGANTATFNIAAGAAAPEGKLNLVIQGKTKINNVDRVIIGPAIPIVVQRPFTVEAAEIKLTPGQNAILKGKIVRQPVFKGAVMLKLDGLPAGLVLAKPLAPVAPEASDFEIEFKVDPKYATPTANLTLTASTTLGAMAYAHPPVTIAAPLAK